MCLAFGQTKPRALPPTTNSASPITRLVQSAQRPTTSNSHLLLCRRALSNRIQINRHLLRVQIPKQQIREWHDALSAASPNPKPEAGFEAGEATTKAIPLPASDPRGSDFDQEHPSRVISNRPEQLQVKVLCRVQFTPRSEPRCQQLLSHAIPRQSRL